MARNALSVPVSRLVLDVAGTVLVKPGLIPAIAASLASFGHGLEDVGIARRHKLLSEAVDVPDRPDAEFYRDFNRRLVAACGVTPTDALVDDVYERCRALPWEVDPGLDALAALGLPLAVASNWDDTLESRLGALTSVKFEAVAGSATAGRRKPDPALLRDLLSQLGWDPLHTAMVGDSVRLDIAPARSLRAHTVLVDRLELFKAHDGPRVADLTGLAARLAGGRLGNDDQNVASP